MNLRSSLATYTVLALAHATQAQTTAPEVPSLEPAPSASIDPSAPANQPAAINAAAVTELLARVQKMEKEYAQQKREVLASIVPRLSTAASSDAAAMDFYFECDNILNSRKEAAEDAIAVKKISTAKDDKKEKERQRQQRLDKMRQDYEEQGHGSVLRLQAEYLLLTLEAPQVKDKSALTVRVRDFINKAMNLIRLSITAPVEPTRKIVATVGGKNREREQEKARELDQMVKARRKIPQQLGQSVLGSVYAQAFNLNNYFKPLEGWVSSPLALNEVYPNYLIPHFRANRRSDLSSIWDEYLSHSLSLQRALLDDPQFARFGLREFKQLEWDKWSDLLINGTNPSFASNELATLFHDNPTHPNQSQWLESLKKLADENKPKPVEAEEPAPTATPTTPAEDPFKF